MNKKSLLTLSVMIVLIVIALLYRVHHRSILLQGEVDAPEVIIVSKAKGRVEQRPVDRGMDVRAGQLLILLQSPELQAQIKSLQAVRDQAAARLAQSEHGTREETLRNLRAVVNKAQADYRNAEADYLRNKRIAGQGYISASQLDASLRARDTAYEQLKAAQADLDQGLHGDRPEQRQEYLAALQQAEQQLAELQVQVDDLKVKAPVDGEVGTLPAEVGQLFNASTPLLTLIRVREAYFVFNLREDILAKVRKGDQVSLQVPALGMEKIEARVGYIAPLGDYATKRATRATGDFDLKTFEVRLYPQQPILGLRPGMSALWQWKD
ncbi:MAG: HlyD family secretion protein [Enterobacteriaceae bacterium]